MTYNKLARRKTVETIVPAILPVVSTLGMTSHKSNLTN